MKVDLALLCDAVRVRDGLLFVLGGGVTRIQRPQFPAPLGVELALRVVVHPTEAEREHALEVFIQGEDGERLAGMSMQFVPHKGSAHYLPGEEVMVPLPLNLQDVAIPKPGVFSVEVMLDNAHQVSIPLLVQAVEAP